MSNEHDVLQVVLFNQLRYRVNPHMTIHSGMRQEITGPARQIKRVGTMASPRKLAYHPNTTLHATHHVRGQMFRS
jgi:hypothetical protein